ncbi:MAG: glutamine--fructose-6-phosphate transaminase (isomerizing) [Candidatus Pacebacteria bacterium]|nr:glutamine--fructose-6-phosphate transaminase (isomerizing) [Candidatus Paceibacterota bacterium]
MCGIVAIIAPKGDIAPVLLDCIKRLEYRGYDSAGVSVANGGDLQVLKAVGPVANLKNRFDTSPVHGNRGIIHTRWATHGEVTEENAHPHVSNDGTISVVHNGIIENHDMLRRRLMSAGYVFHSQTDTEVIPNLIELKLLEGANCLEDAVASAVEDLDGAYAIAVVSSMHPEIVIARQSSDLFLGLNGGTHYVASDDLAFAGYASHTVPIKDGDILTLKNDGTYHFREHDAARKRDIEVFDADSTSVDKGTYDSFMRKEIYDQPNALKLATAGRITLDGEVVLGGIRNAEERLACSRMIEFVACGTSLYASTIGAQMIEGLARIPARASHASEFQYRDPILNFHDAVIAVSQSGSTADTLNAARLAMKEGALTLGINNRVGSSLSRETGAGIYLHAGSEIGVASTKAFTAQVAVMALLAARLATLAGQGHQPRVARLVRGLRELPDKVALALTCEQQVKEIAQIYKDAKSVFCLGRGFAVPLAYEGALKLKEIGQLNAEGYPGGELKHGPLALIERGVPVIAVICKGDGLEGKMISNLEEVRARGGDVIVITSGMVALPDGLAKHVIVLPQVPPELISVIGAIPYQLLAYHVGVAQGFDVDKPRNLAKSVTVE